MRRILAEERLVGAAWGTVDTSGAITSDAAGMKDNAGQLPFTPATRFHVGSVAKTVLATGILRLVTEQRIALDDPVARYLPTLRIDNRWVSTDPVTVRHLLDHTSGLDDARLWHMFSAKADPEAPLSSAFSRSHNTLRVRVRPGSATSYSNMGYTVLGMLIEAVTKSRYEDYLDAHLLQPLRMRNSTFRFTTQEGPSADSSLAWGHLDGGRRHAAVATAIRPAGQLTTTAHDLALFARFLMSDGWIDGREFIRPDLMRARGMATTTDAARAGLTGGYALGLSRRVRRGVIGYCHIGNILGFVGMVCTYPDIRKAFVISVNTDSESARYERLFERLAEHLGVAPAPPPPVGAPARDIADWEGLYVPSPHRSQTLAWADATFGFLRADWRRDTLYLTRLQGPGRALWPVGGYLFAAQDRAATTHALFRVGEEHRISDGFTTFREVSLVYLAALWISCALGVAGLLWFLGAGIVALARWRRAALRRPEMIPFAGVVGLLAAAPLFLTQSFMQLGDLTPASVVLAMTSAVLPLTMVAFLWRAARSRPRPRMTWVHTCAAVTVLVWCGVLASWDLLPLRLWT